MDGHMLNEGRLGAVICAVVGAIGVYGVATGHTSHWLTVVACGIIEWALWCEEDEKEDEE